MKFNSDLDKLGSFSELGGITTYKGGQGSNVKGLLGSLCIEKNGVLGYSSQE